MVNVRDFFSISPTLLYKIVAKVLTERLKSSFPKLKVHFSRIREILDPILIANEAVEYSRMKKLSGWLIKLDVEKAFDCVGWGFLEEVLKL